MVQWTVVFVAVAAVTGVVSSQQYFGKKLGSLKSLEHGVRGDVYAVDSRTLHIRNFNYDGQGPDAFFYVGSGSRPSNAGYKVPDENGSTKPLGAYKNKHVTLTLPNGVTMDKVQWVSVWCKAYSVDFGNIIMPRPVTDYPRPQRVGRMATIEHDVASGDVVVVDAQTLLVPDFTYDGEGPDAHFWVGKGPKPSRDGSIVPDENGGQSPLRKYSRKTVVLTLPGDQTVFDVDYLSIWCRQFSADFGHVEIDRRSLNVPPSLKMLGVRPQTKLNCEVLDDELSFEVRWAVAGESIVMQLVSKIDARQYMAFGVSGVDTRSVMTGADAVVTWLDRDTGQGFAHDYFLQDKAQCSGGQGTCPDDQLRGGKNDVRLLNSAFINGFSMLTLQRPLKAADRLDRSISTQQPQAVIWAVGPVSGAGDIGYHRRRVRGDLLLHFGRRPAWNCPVTTGAGGAPGRPAPPAPRPSTAWQIPPIACNEPEDRVLYAQIGPTGGARGYDAITGRAGWGVAWYVNGLLIPEISVVRGQTYTFVVEGGRDPERPAKYHPLYITDDPDGGYQFKTDEERARVRVFAGVEVDREGGPRPTAGGRLCEWLQSAEGQSAGTLGSFGAFQRTLQLDCEEGQPGILQWTPDRHTPDTVYYQCFTHRFLGWKINVLDSCPFDEGIAASELNEVDRIMKDVYDDYDYYEDGLAQSSVRLEQTLTNSLPPQPAADTGRPAGGPGPNYADFHVDLEVARRPLPPPAGPPSSQPGQSSVFDFGDFPPGFPRPELPLPRPPFNFGERIRTRKPAVLSATTTPGTTLSSDESFVPEVEADSFDAYQKGAIQSDRKKLQLSENSKNQSVFREPPIAEQETASVPPRRTLNRINRPPLQAHSKPPPPRQRPALSPGPLPPNSSGNSQRPSLETFQPPLHGRPATNTHQAPSSRTTRPPPTSRRPSLRSTRPPSRFTRPQPRSTRPPPRPTRPISSSRSPAPAAKPPNIASSSAVSRPPYPFFSVPSPEAGRRQPALDHGVRESPSAQPRVPPVVLDRPQGEPATTSSRPEFSQPRPVPPGHGFDPKDIVYETGFKPVKHSDRNNPPLAFEVADVAAAESGHVSSAPPASRSPAPPATAFRPSAATQGGFRVSWFGEAGGRPQAVNIPLPVSVVPVRPPAPRPGGFLSGLLGYLPSLRGGRPAQRRSPPHFANPNRVLELDSAGRPSNGLRVPENHPHVPVPYPVLQAGPVGSHLSLESRPARAGPQRLPSTPQMQAVFERDPFRPSPVDSDDFQPVPEPPQSAPPSRPQGASHGPAARPQTAHTHAPYAESDSTPNYILEDIWSRMRAAGVTSKDDVRERRDVSRAIRSTDPYPELVLEPEDQPADGSDHVDPSNTADRIQAAAWQFSAPLFLTLVIRWRH
ncbi:protein Skeletor, isoforms B/C-like [Pollicipes pollicipes]|uniref:protein Skeletor, isoforms B/C-like n=1 Tax=Pollicipes pollicipes TaxID=41117 RepID=UPI001884AB3B|nr:protein Skeletor, isoforms B/C-like [Pollicipes pollicipes]